MAKEKILVVDDDKDLLRGLSARLKASGYKVFAATDAVLATSMARKVEPDLIILDIGLPGGDGFMVMERLGNLMIDVPIIVLTARGPSTEDRVLDKGAAAFFQKPADNEELLSAIRRVFAGQHCT